MSEAINFNEELVRLWKQRERFSPFTIILTSGDHYEVTEPIQMALGENVVALVPRGSTQVFFRKNQIVGVEVHEPAA
jgi:hypothetical protein